MARTRRLTLGFVLVALCVTVCLGPGCVRRIVYGGECTFSYPWWAFDLLTLVAIAGVIATVVAFLSTEGAAGRLLVGFLVLATMLPLAYLPKFFVDRTEVGPRGTKVWRMDMNSFRVQSEESPSTPGEK